MNELFQFLENPFYEVRIDLHPPTRCTVNFVSESIINLSTILLNTVLENINSSASLNAFRFNVKHWTLNHQPYPFCKTYIGFYCITYTFQSESSLYSCPNFKEHLVKTGTISKLYVTATGFKVSPLFSPNPFLFLSISLFPYLIFSTAIKIFCFKSFFLISLS